MSTRCKGFFGVKRLVAGTYHLNHRFGPLFQRLPASNASRPKHYPSQAISALVATCS